MISPQNRTKRWIEENHSDSPATSTRALKSKVTIQILLDKFVKSFFFSFQIILFLFFFPFRIIKFGSTVMLLPLQQICLAKKLRKVMVLLPHVKVSRRNRQTSSNHFKVINLTLPRNHYHHCH